MEVLTRGLAAAATVALLAAPVAAQEGGASGSAPQTMLILDGSRSMWVQIDGTAKLEIARKAIARMLADWPHARPVGLIAYGHRAEGDCSDIEVLAEPASLDRAAFMKMAESITPQGKTPIGAAVERAAETLGVADRASTVILVTDGRETCGADLCDLGKTLEKTGTAFTAHVIGFDVDDGPGELACLAEEAGGRFMAASDSESLSDGLQVARAESPAPMALRRIDAFERADLGSDWDVINPNPSGYLLDNGALLSMTVKPGDIGAADAANIFRWQGVEIPDGDHAITDTFTAEMGW